MIFYCDLSFLFVWNDVVVVAIFVESILFQMIIQISTLKKKTITTRRVCYLIRNLRKLIKNYKSFFFCF